MSKNDGDGAGGVMDIFMKMFKDYIAFHPEEFRAGDKKPEMNSKVITDGLKAYQAKVWKVITGEEDPPVYYEDAEQTPMKRDSQKAKLFIEEWFHSIKYDPLLSSWLSDWCRVLMCGDFQGMMNILKDMSEEEIAKLLKKRESFAQVGAVFHVIMGAMGTGNEDMSDRGRDMIVVNKEYKKCLLKLMSLGAEVNNHDTLGNTPLHLLAMNGANEITVVLAEILIRHGANCNARKWCKTCF